MIDKDQYTLRILLNTVGILMLLYLCHGFIAFNNDTIETIPYAQWLHDSSIFSKDFHIQYISKQFPNERFWVSWTLHFFPNALFLASLFFHILFSVMLISGMLRLADYILKDLTLSAVSVMMALGLFYTFNLGGNELYYNMYVPSLVGKALGVWAIYFFIIKKIIPSAVIIGISTLFQPLVGIQLFLILSGVILLQRKSIDYWIKWLFTYGVIGGIWFVLLLMHQKGDVETSYQFSDIIYSRIGHHFYPSLFSWKKSLPVIGLIAIGLYIFYELSKPLFYFFLLTLVGCIVYIIGITMNLDLVLSTQWMKTTIWLKFLACIAIVYPLSSYLFVYQKRLKQVLLALVFALSLMVNSPSSDYEYDKELVTYVKENTSKDALFVVPLEMTDFRARTKRSTYFDYKAMIHHRPEIFEWANRLKEVYNIDLAKRQYIGFNGVDNRYLSSTEFLPLSEIDYIITPSGKSLPSPWNVVFTSNDYTIFKKK